MPGYRRATYVDSSALVKVITREDESDAAWSHLFGRRHVVSSALAHTEVLRALLPHGTRAERRGRQALARCELIRIGERVLDEAASLRPHGLRSLDAIHLATARSLGRDLSHVVTYDTRMAQAAESMGLTVRTPT